ncbi:hypothetical protein [Jeotgalicoccus halotolerans]|uniref:Uncharacterized protein n=1 Tax=Jeotgalicoccus halotolerans TaxID=157227 RepID=A0A3E0B378_9STAP|nr:hypothetical protein [Jeotgalicoccus halotolerans]REG26404.1 hypothetical protein DFR63_0047 [Jeotgalicoccus halotolerans]
MEIIVKRRTWFLGWLMPISIKFNGKTIGSVGGYQTKTMEIPEDSGTLTYEQPLDRTDRIEVKDGDVVLVKETIINKIFNIVFVVSMLFFIVSNSLNIYTESYPYPSDFLRISGIAVTIIFVVFIIISFFFNSYKFVIENNSSKE